MRNYFILIFLSFLSCKNSTTVQETKIQKSDKNIVQKHKIALILENISKEKVANWKEYQSVTNNLKQFSAISANEALNNALKLLEEVKFLKDSIRPKELLNMSFRTRINVLENETLRLKDMTFISAITADEVNTQVDKILAAFSATNSKINTIYSQLKVDEEIN
jgi:ABC-type ATPase with predicted acetyltransferase domain